HTRTLSEIFLNKFRTNHSDELCRRAVCNCFHQHSLSSTGRSVKEDTARRVDTDLLIQVEMCEWQFNSFPDLLLLHVQTTNIGIGNVRLLILSEHGNRRIGLWW